MWCTRYYAHVHKAKQTCNIRISVLQCLSKSINSTNSHKKTDDVKNPTICNNTTPLTPQSQERGYPKESCVNSSNSIESKNLLQAVRTNNYKFIQKDESFANDFNAYDEIKPPHPLDICTEDLSDFGPVQVPSYNIAKFANTSKTIQKLMKLGVQLYKHESKVDLMEFLLSKDFEKDLFPYIRFLHDCGIPADYLGTFLSKNLSIFQQDMDDLHTRIRYLRFHNFDIEMIKTILQKNPMWLNYSTQFIDTRLSYFQYNFKLNGYEVRKVAVTSPKLITYSMKKIMENTFAVKEEMGFDPRETKELLIKIPSLWQKSRICSTEKFDYIHNQMKLSHAAILSEPHVLLCRKKRIEERHSFLVKLGRAQYDPSKPLYVSLMSLITGTDEEFCKNVAKTGVEVYDLHLKTM